MRPIFLGGLLALAGAASAEALAADGADRCALVTLVAKQVCDVEDFSGRLPARGARLHLFVAVYRRKEGDYRSVLEQGDDCPNASIPRTHSPGPAIDVTFGAGTQSDLNPDLHYLLVRSKRQSANRWSFTWKVGDSVTGCAAGSPCPEAQSLEMTSPTLKLVVVRQGTRLTTSRAALDLFRYSEP